MRLLHTADWHLGHRLKDFDRQAEHEHFLAWLLEVIGAEGVDALLIAGDIFDSANPPSAALKTWYGFLGEARRRFPALDIVAIGGNHDSAARLEAPRALLEPLGVQVLGGARRRGREPDCEPLVIPLHDAEGRVAARVAAVPYLRPFDLPPADGSDPLVAGVRAFYDRALSLARERAGPDEAIVAMGHLYLAGTRLSELSERKVLGGNLHALPPDLFADDVAYAALGHLHLAQVVGRDGVRYAGSPIPLSMAERGYDNQVLLVELDGPRLAAVRPLPVPRPVEFLRVPDQGSLPLAEALAELGRLELPASADGAGPPFVEVAVRLDQPEPGLRAEVEAALEDRPLRLVRIATELTGHGLSLAEAGAGQCLDELDPEEVLHRRWAAEHEAELPAEVLAAFRELLEQVQRGEEP